MGTPRDFNLTSGTIAAEISGPEKAPLVVAIGGITSTLRSYDTLIAALPTHRWLAFDARGRGLSDKTPSGTYGWPAHARDVLEMVDQLGAKQFDVVGWSMGVWIAMTLAERVPQRVRRLILVDALGAVDEAVKVPIGGALQRLENVYPSREAMYEYQQSTGLFEPWSAWEPHFERDTTDVEGGVQRRTRLLGPIEDERHRQSQDLPALWRRVRHPALLLYAAQPIPPDHGHVLRHEDYEQFLRDVPTAQGKEINAHHYNIVLHPDTIQAVRSFLS